MSFDYDAYYHADGYPKQLCRQCGNVIHLSCHISKWKDDPSWQFYPQEGNVAKGICKGVTEAGWYYLHFAIKLRDGKWSHRLAYFREKSKHFE